MCGSMQKAAAKVLRRWMVDHGIPAEIIEMLLGPELPDDDARPAPRKNLIRNAMMVAYQQVGCNLLHRLTLSERHSALRADAVQSAP